MSRFVKTLTLLAACVVALGIGAAAPPDTSRQTDGARAEDLYRHRDDIPSAKRAAAIWAAQASSAYEPAWKLARISYWIGTNAPANERRAALDQGEKAGETAVRLAPGKPEGHFWLAANMGELAENFGVMQELKYRGRIRDELQRVIAIQPDWQDASAECGLGQWYYEVPGWLGGSRKKGKDLLEHALAAHPQSKTALSFMADIMIAEGKKTEARGLLQRVLESPLDPDWTPEDLDLQKKAAALLKTLK
jgi:hypothetical protein